MDLGVRKFFGQRERDGARTGADVKHAKSCVGRALLPASPMLSCKSQRSLNQVLGLWTRNENRRSNDEVHPPEFLMSSDVLRGNATGALGESSIITHLFFGGQFAFGVCK